MNVRDLCRATYWVFISLRDHTWVWTLTGDEWLSQQLIDPRGRNGDGGRLDDPASLVVDPLGPNVKHDHLNVLWGETC